MLFWILSAVFILPYIYLLLFFRRSWNEPQLPAEATNIKGLPFITVVIPARNEEGNIGKCLQSILHQNYPNELWEIVVADDHSTDATAQIVSSFASKKITLISLRDYNLPAGFNSFKKFGIETAISLAKGDLIITTDADCEASPEWLNTIGRFETMYGSTLIAAPVEFEKPVQGEATGTKLLKIFQYLDFLSLQGITGAVVKSGFANMCNGANLAYTKKAFYEVQGFEGIDRLASGDDMLLMEKISTLKSSKIHYLQSREAIVRTKPAVSVHEFFNQRIRWASKSSAYGDGKLKLVLILVFLVNFWMLFLAVSAFFSTAAFKCLLPVFLLKVVFELIFLYPVASFFGSVSMLRWFVFAQPFHILYTVLTGALGSFGKYEWKGRKVK